MPLRTRFRSVKLSLSDLLGRRYAEAVCEARSRLAGEPVKRLKAIASRKVDFFPRAYQERLLRLLPRVGQAMAPALVNSARGAASRAFEAATNTQAAPVSGFGYFRMGENGKLYLLTKSEHYHALLGHGFPGYRLIETAKALGIPNATHNNTRGHITRLLEEELVRLAAGLRRSDRAGLETLLASTSPSALNRVLNLQTGSLAAEAALKVLLSRFYRVQSDSPEPKYSGRIPVVVVVGEEAGGLQGNYHGTTIFAQALRGMWPGLLEGLEKSRMLLVRAVRPNNIGDLENLFGQYEAEPYKIAGVFYEPVMMNYGALRLSEEFMLRLHELCEKHDAPTVADEIQTCVWSPRIYFLREYGVRPSIVVVGKGFSGGEYPASRILCTSVLDTLPQFGALVTNGQEELASLSYLVTIRWAEANAEVTRKVGEHYEERLRALAEDYPRVFSSIQGRRHLVGLHFHDLESGKTFARRLNEAGLDISLQTYKTSVPPCALTKLPITVGYEAVDVVIAKMRAALKGI